MTLSLARALPLCALFGALLCPLARAADPTDLADPGQGFERWQWACMPDPQPNEPMGRSVQRQVPFELRREDKSAPARWVWTQEHPFNPALVQSARGQISPASAAVAYRKADGLPHLRLEVEFKEGVLWRGIPVTRFASHHAPTGSYAYFATPLSRERIAQRFAQNDPRSASEWDAFHREQLAGDPSPKSPALKESLRKLAALRPVSAPASAAENASDKAFFKDYFKVRMASASELLPGDQPLPGLSKIGCFDGPGQRHGWSRLEIR